MHLPDAILSGPVLIATGVVGAAGLAVCLKRMRDTGDERTPLMAGMVAAFVFAAQMVNFPIMVGASGHLIGGVLASVVLGPWAGAVAIAAVLTVQSLLFADGGVTALGANFVNMGLINAGLGYVLYREIRRLAGGGRRGTIIGAVVAAWLGVILAAAACAIELAASGRWSAFGSILGMLTLVHALIGVGEALITGLVVQAVLQVRPELIPDPDIGSPSRTWQVGRVALTGLGVALAVAIFLGPLAYSAPDGLEYSNERLEIQAGEVAPPPTAVMPDYEAPLPGGGSLALATAVAGAAGSLVVFAFAAVLGLGSTRLAPATITAQSSAEG